MTRMTREITIEWKDEKQFREVHHLITQWRNHHFRFHQVCSKRVNWYRRGASTLEKNRRREKWEIVASVLEIENRIIHICARQTHDREIYTPKSGRRFSRLLALRREYEENRRASRYAKGVPANRKKGIPEMSPKQVRKKLRIERIAIVAEIRGIIRKWITIVYHAVFGPEKKPSKPLPLHRAELIPRKLKKAYTKLRKELAA